MLDVHLGYDRHENATQTANRQNGASSKIVRSQLGEIDIDIPRDREASFEPQLVPKHQKDVLPIEDCVLAMYAKGQSQRDITSTIQDIYGFNISPETISKITERIVPPVQEFRNRSVKTEAGAGQKALYNMIESYHNQLRKVTNRKARSPTKRRCSSWFLTGPLPPQQRYSIKVQLWIYRNLNYSTMCLCTLDR